MGASSSTDYQYTLERRGASGKSTRQTDTRVVPVAKHGHYLESVYDVPSPLSWSGESSVHGHRGRKVHTSHEPPVRSHSYTRKRSKNSQLSAGFIQDSPPQGFQYRARVLVRSPANTEDGDPGIASKLSAARTTIEAQHGEVRRIERSSTHSQKSKATAKASTRPPHRPYR